MIIDLALPGSSISTSPGIGFASRAPSEALWLTYEQLFADKEGTLRQALEFLGFREIGAIDQELLSRKYGTFRDGWIGQGACTLKREATGQDPGAFCLLPGRRLQAGMAAMMRAYGFRMPTRANDRRQRLLEGGSFPQEGESADRVGAGGRARADDPGSAPAGSEATSGRRSWRRTPRTGIRADAGRSACAPGLRTRTPLRLHQICTCSAATCCLAGWK